MSGPSLEGVAGRLSEGQMRLRLVDGRRLNPASIMPSYYRVDGLMRVATAYAGKTGADGGGDRGRARLSHDAAPRRQEVIDAPTLAAECR